MERSRYRSTTYDQRASGFNPGHRHPPPSQSSPYADLSRNPYESAGGFDEFAVLPGRHSTQRHANYTPQGDLAMVRRRVHRDDGEGRRGMEDNYEATDMYTQRSSTPRGPQGSRVRERHHPNELNHFDIEDLIPHRSSTRVAAPRKRSAGSRFMNEAKDDMSSHSPRGLGPRNVDPYLNDRDSRTRMTEHQSPLSPDDELEFEKLDLSSSDLEEEVAVAEERRQRARRQAKKELNPGGSKNSNRVHELVDGADSRVRDAKMDIQMHKSRSKRHDNAARSTRRPPAKASRLEERVSRHGVLMKVFGVKFIGECPGVCHKRCSKAVGCPR